MSPDWETHTSLRTVGRQYVQLQNSLDVKEVCLILGSCGSRL